MSRAVEIARSEHEVGYVSLSMTVEGIQTIWTVSYRDGGITARLPFSEEVDARREYDRRRKSVGSLA